MKNFLFINYGINVEKIYIKNNKKYFFINNNKIYIYEIKNDLEKIKKLVILTNDLFQKKINVYTLLVNRLGNFYTEKDDNYIILLKVNEPECIIDLNEIIKFFNIKSDLNNTNILDDWKSEIDIIEKEIIEYNKEYLLIQDSLNYFIGLGENAIELLQNYENVILLNNDSIGHKIDYNLFYDYDLNNPLNFIKINKMYDLANYIKYKFFRNNLSYYELDYIFNNFVQTEYDEVFLYSCLLYPSCYFNLIKNIFLKKEKESRVNYFINNVNNYEKLLLYCKKNVKNTAIISLINWIKE